ncbi:MAG TPA: NrfD/PsrC family molybdoenzyme membrane anchor subunit [Burkholderiaceae bacterium]|nr:NrfD/PsrC family molybdoenzyme membrane anchor subunit [Burkholderiaceae bacterium]
MQITELLTPHYEAAWLPWAVQYFFLVGVATGAALLTAWGACCRPTSVAARALPVTVMLLLVTAITAPFSLLADLHQPARFWHFYAHLTPWSWMSLGSLLMPIFVALSLSMCAAWWRGSLRWMRILSLPLAASAVSILLYTGGEIVVVRARPLWHNPWVPVNLALTAWLATVGASLLLTLWVPAGRDTAVRAWLGKLGLWLSLALLAVAALWVAGGLLSHDASYQAAMDLYRNFPIWRISIQFSVVLGVLVLALWLRPTLWLRSTALLAALGVMSCAAAWGFRWALFMGVQSVPKYGAGLYVYHMPLGGDGLMGILGIFGLAVAVLTLALWALERWPARDASAPAA